jgi:polar amino acid transport system permease protein
MTVSAPERARPEPIKAVPVRHPGRWVTIVILAVLTAMFIHMLMTNTAFDWGFMVDNMFRPPVLAGVRGTLVLTVISMAIGIVIGIIVAIMRLSPNPILKGAAFLYTWFFRSVPRLVLLAVFGNLGILYQRVGIGLPFGEQIGRLFGLENFDGQIFGFRTLDLLTAFVAGLLGLALSEGAYMAEIVRAGIQSVDPGQSEAASALGMSRGQVLRRVVLPQAMRVIIPPTGNETIAMLKDTSLVIYIPIAYELFNQLDSIGKRTFNTFPMYVAACLWYLALTSFLLVGQYYIEKRYSRGYGTTQKARMKLRDLSAEHGEPTEGGQA